MVLKVDSSESVENVTYKCTITDGDGTRTATLDSDQIIIIRISEQSTTLTFTAEKEGYGTDVTTLSLEGIELEPADNEEEETT